MDFGAQIEGEEEDFLAEFAGEKEEGRVRERRDGGGMRRWWWWWLLLLLLCLLGDGE